MPADYLVLVRVAENVHYRASDGAVDIRATYVFADLDSARTGERQAFNVILTPNVWGLADKIRYPRCSEGPCASSPAGTSITLDTDWSSGRIARVNGWTNDLTYHPSGSWSTIPHTNGTSDAHVVQTNNNARTQSLNTTNPGNLWNTGAYFYDGSGNILQIGDNKTAGDLYRYDKVNRLTRAYVVDPIGGETRQDYTYDVFGNMTEVKTWPAGGGSQTTTIAVNANTNRLSVASYDASGNMTTWGSDGYEYDTANNMVNQDDRWLFLYNFSGERVATIDWQGSIATREVDWTIRGPSNQVLSTFNLTGEDQSGNWSHTMDYIWMGRRLLGTQDGSGIKQHYHTDHLGSVRLVTDDLGNKVSEHEYLPYGQELTAAGNGIMKFTGHERDSDTGMDYMHARYYTGHLGRMMSVDPVQRGDGVWNMYSYVGGNPIRAIDPDGRKLWAWFKGLFGGGGGDSNVSSQTHGSSGPGFWGRVKRAFGGGSKKSDGNTTTVVEENGQNYVVTRDSKGNLISKYETDVVTVTDYSDAVYGTLDDVGAAVGALSTNYVDLFSANTIDADLYFHCKGNCEAALYSSTASSVAGVLSDSKEIIDYYIKGYRDGWRDQAANWHGRNVLPGGDCVQHCGVVRPPGLGPTY